MGFDITYPNIGGGTDTEKIDQIRRYLYQLADQLKWALNTVEGGGSGNVTASSQSTAVMAQTTFNAVKALIMNSADILNAYYNKLDKKFEERYVTKKESLDFVTETGESGNWKYQRYASGFTVAYGSFVKDYKCSTMGGGAFYDTATFEIPSEMFTSIWNIASSLVASNGVRGITVRTVTESEITSSVWSMEKDAEEVSLRIDLTVTGFKNITGG